MEPIKRDIRSFVKREGRFTEAQRYAIDSLWPDFGLSKNDLADLDAAFERRAPRFLEIGCGSGDAIISLAKANPDNDYIGIEVHSPGLGSILQRVRDESLSNVRLLNEDAVVCLKEGLPDNALDGAMIFFPDPWPKKRHHKRRLIQRDFLSLIATKLKKNARLFAATDWQDYADFIVEHSADHPDLINLAQTVDADLVVYPRPNWRPITRYEKRAHRLGHIISDFCFCKK